LRRPGGHCCWVVAGTAGQPKVQVAWPSEQQQRQPVPSGQLLPAPVYMRRLRQSVRADALTLQCFHCAAVSSMTVYCDATRACADHPCMQKDTAANDPLGPVPQVPEMVTPQITHRFQASHFTQAHTQSHPAPRRLLACLLQCLLVSDAGNLLRSDSLQV
jgi:hypothetical protein